MGKFDHILKKESFFLSITLRTTCWPFGRDQAKVPCSYLDFSVRLLRSGGDDDFLMES